MERIIVLLSSYNGQKYIREQINSILNQKNVEVELIVRDDGSTDGTLSILEDYKNKCINFSYYQGQNLGPAFSFLDLIKHAPDAAYYSLADQDDIWEEDKLFSGIQMLKKKKGEVPLLYHCNTRVVNKDLEFIRNGKKDIRVKSKYSSLMENRATGCTMIFNVPAKELINSCDPTYVSMHDTWIYLIISFFGVVIYDIRPHMSYRQHGNNVIGASVSKTTHIKNKIKRILDFNKMPRYKLAQSFLAMYGNRLSVEEFSKVKKLVDYKKSLKGKMRLMVDQDFKSDSFARNVEYFLLTIFGNL